MGEPPGFSKIHQDDKIASEEQIYTENYRPQFHFTTHRGWINDENGLVCYKGRYHLFYQHNPFGIEWGANFYAVYTYSNIPPEDGRAIQLAWMRGGEYPDMPFNQQLTFPCELSLRATPDGLRLCRRPVREIKLLRAKEHKWQNIIIKPGQNPLSGITGELFEIQAEINLADAEQIGFDIRGVPVVYGVLDRRIRCLGRDGPLTPVNSRIKLHLLIDRTSPEIFGNDGVFSMSNCILSEDSNKTLQLFYKGGDAKLLCLKLWHLKSAWNR